MKSFEAMQRTVRPDRGDEQGELFEKEGGDLPSRDALENFEINSFGGVESTLRMFGELFATRAGERRERRLLSSQRRRVRESGVARFPYRHFTLYFDRNDFEGTPPERPWTISFHGIDPAADASARREVAELLEKHRITMIETETSGRYELSRI